MERHSGLRGRALGAANTRPRLPAAGKGGGAVDLAALALKVQSADMAEGPSPHELSERLARLEERMKTMQAEYKTDIARLAEDAAKRDTETARRETRLILALIGIVAAAVAILKFF